MSLNCSTSTVSYSESAKGFPSFYSFIPEYMIGMNSFFYSFSGGDLYRHNTNETRNRFYGENYSSTITSVFNPQPTQSIKLFKTMSYESTTTSNDSSNAAWACTRLTTDLTDGSPGSMLRTYFEQKEGEWFSFLRNNSGTVNWKARSANGVGVCTAITSIAGNSTVIDFSVQTGSVVSIGDTLFGITINNGVAVGVPKLAGVITAVTSTSITILDTPPPNGAVPTVGQYIAYIKSAVAESHGARGYYMEFTLTNSSTVAVELFSVGSSVMKSNP